MIYILILKYKLAPK